MKEIEILVQVFADEADVLRKLSKFEFLGDKRTVDTYYYDPLRPELQPDGNGHLYACCRTRQKDGVNYITYKNDHFDGDTWLYSDEAETTVADMSTLCEIMHALGLRELIKIDNLKRTYRAGDYTIEFETVADLGLFLEVEYCTPDDVDVAQIKSQIQSFIDNLGFAVSPELNAGKPELMLRKKQQGGGTMLILNINGPINSGKSTVSKQLVQMLPHAVFIEVDDLLSDDEEKKLGLTMQAGWGERLNRLDRIIANQKNQRQYETIIFAYPMTENLYRRWSAHIDKNTRFIAVTLAPSLEKCLTNRGTRTLTDWEIGRIREMYNENYHRPKKSDLIINNDGQTPHQTAQQIADFVTKQR